MRHLGAVPRELEPAEQAGLIRLSPESVTFQHPLIRTTVYPAAPLARRLAVHRALATVCGEAGDLDRAWHLSAGAAGSDETIAAELERAATDKRARGGHASAAMAYERAAELSPGDAARAHRLTERP